MEAIDGLSGIPCTFLPINTAGSSDDHTYLCSICPQWFGEKGHGAQHERTHHNMHMR